MNARLVLSGPQPLEGPLSAAEFARLRRLTAKMPLAWTVSRRRRRLMFLALAAPGFFAVFLTPLHRNLVVLIAGLCLFGVACLFRQRSERLFERAEASAVWPPFAHTNRQEDQTHA